MSQISLINPPDERSRMSFLAVIGGCRMSITITYIIVQKQMMVLLLQVESIVTLMAMQHAA